MAGGLRCEESGTVLLQGHVVELLRVEGWCSYEHIDGLMVCMSCCMFLCGKFRSVCRLCFEKETGSWKEEE